MEQNIQNVQPNAQPDQPEKKKSKVGCWIIGCLTALIVVVLFIAGIIGFAFWATQGPVKAVEAQLICLRNGDIQGAYELTSGDFRKTTDLSAFEQFVAGYPSLSQNEDYFFANREIDNNRGYIEGALIAVDGSKTPVKYDLIKEDGKWKIMFIEISPIGIQPIEIDIEAPSGITSIKKIEVGTKRARDGTIADSGTRFPQDIGEVEVSAYILGVKEGQNVYAVWFFAGEEISDPVTNYMDEDGDFISQFSMTPPFNGWPTGKYKVVVFIDNGDIKKEVEYTVGI